MDWLTSLVIAAVGAAIVIVVWFGKLPSIRRARTGSGGHPNLVWWVSFGTAVLLIAYTANQLPDHL